MNKYKKEIDSYKQKSLQRALKKAGRKKLSAKFIQHPNRQKNTKRNLRRKIVSEAYKTQKGYNYQEVQEFLTKGNQKFIKRLEDFQKIDVAEAYAGKMLFGSFVRNLQDTWNEQGLTNIEIVNEKTGKRIKSTAFVHAIRKAKEFSGHKNTKGEMINFFSTVHLIANKNGDAFKMLITITDEWKS